MIGDDLMKRFLNGIFAFVLIFAFALIPKIEAAEIVIFHTNDMHARVSPEDDNGQTIGLAEFSAAVKAEKIKNPNTLWLDGGDTLHGMPNINISKGENMVELLNETPLNATVPGNHDYNYGAARLIELSKKLNATVLSANTIYKNTKKNVFKPYKIFKLTSGIKVGVFGLTTPETAYKSSPKNVASVEFLNPIEQSEIMIKKLRKKCDVLICVMHMGLDKSSEFTSERIAKETSGIDLIVDAHSHTALENGLKVGNTLIVQTVWHGYRLGEVKIDVDNHKINSINAKLLDADDVKNLANKPDAAVLNKLKEINTRSEKFFNEVVAHSDRKLSGDRLLVRRHESELGNLTADALKWRTKSDIAVTNGGDLRTDLPEGDITRRDILSIFPFDNSVQVALIKGKTVHEMLEHSVFAYPESFGGFLNVSGLTFSFDPTKPIGQRVSEIYVGDELLDENKTYSIAAADFTLSGGDDYSMFKNAKIISNYENVEDILIEYMNQVGMKGYETGRITVLNDVVENEAA